MKNRKIMHDLNLYLYGKNLRDFCNNDVKIVREKSRYLFMSKQERLCFRVVEVPFLLDTGRKLADHILYTIIDEIFAEIQDLRNEDNNEVF